MAFILVQLNQVMLSDHDCDLCVWYRSWKHTQIYDLWGSKKCIPAHTPRWASWSDADKLKQSFFPLNSWRGRERGRDVPLKGHINYQWNIVKRLKQINQRRNSVVQRCYRRCWKTVKWKSMTPPDWSGELLLYKGQVPDTNMPSDL